jgi:polysaccharide deacetylase family protein (PEP-CTERM system associated)
MNFLTFDLEEFYHANFPGFDFSSFETRKTRLDASIDRLLDICDRYSIKATWFILGSVAERKPAVIRKIHAAGHEIASHGYSHRLVSSMSPDEFRKDLKMSCMIIENITGDKVLGFRAPSWSVNEAFLCEYYDILEEQGMKYSSSVYPGKTFLYGIDGFPQNIHFPVINDRKSSILEIPVPCLNILGKKLGFSGGFYLRVFPKWFIAEMIGKRNKDGEPVFIYLHPWELNMEEQSLDLPLKHSIIHSWGLRGCEKKLENLVADFSDSFVMMREVVRLQGASKS